MDSKLSRRLTSFSIKDNDRNVVKVEKPPSRKLTFFSLPAEIRLEVYLHCSITHLPYIAAASSARLYPEIASQFYHILNNSKVHVNVGVGTVQDAYLRSCFERIYVGIKTPLLYLMDNEKERKKWAVCGLGVRPKAERRLMRDI